MKVSNEKALTKLCPYKIGYSEGSERCSGDECMAFILDEKTELGECGMLNKFHKEEGKCSCG